MGRINSVGAQRGLETLTVVPKLSMGRAVVEREFGRLKNESALLPLRVRGLDRVRLHADLTILAKLSAALARSRAVPRVA